MAIEVNLEKYGHKKKGFLGFSWTAFFFNFFVPLFRLDFVGFLIFIKEFDNENVIVSASLFSAILRALSRLILPFFYNKMYTQKLLKQGYLPPEDDEYSNALLKGNRFLEYTNEELLDEEKMERYKVIIEEYENERKKDMHTIIIVLVLIGVLIAFFYFMTSYS